MPVKTPYLVIDIDEPSRYTPALSQVDRLLKQSLLETQSLQVVRQLLMRGDVEKAQQNGHGKLLAAAAMRTQATGEKAPGEKAPKPASAKAKRGMATRQLEELAKTQITGPRLLLFVLEHTSQTEWRTNEQIMDTLRATGQASHIRILSGIYGMLARQKYLRHHEQHGYQRTATGKTFAISLRKELENSNGVLPGQYLAPANYQKKTQAKLGFKPIGGGKKQPA